jgi:PadR family transcriptional regulator PadR
MLGTLELYVLLTVLRQNGTAYGVSIAEDLEERTGKRWSLGAIYTTLDRLKTKRYVTAKNGEPTPERGGRAKIYFEITGLGQTAANDALDATQRVKSGIRGLRGATI